MLVRRCLVAWRANTSLRGRAGGAFSPRFSLLPTPRPLAMCCGEACERVSNLSARFSRRIESLNRFGDFGERELALPDRTLRRALRSSNQTLHHNHLSFPAKSTEAFPKCLLTGLSWAGRGASWLRRRLQRGYGTSPLPNPKANRSK
jgi:hypothetical protein